MELPSNELMALSTMLSQGGGRREVTRWLERGADAVMEVCDAVSE